MPVSRISILLLVVGVISFPQVVAAQLDPQSNDQAVKAYQDLLKSYEANRQDRQFVRPFLELAQKYPGTQPALDSLKKPYQQGDPTSVCKNKITTVF